MVKKRTWGMRASRLGSLWLAGGACLGPTPPGLGTPSPKASERLRAQQEAGEAAAVERALDVGLQPLAAPAARYKALRMSLGWLKGSSSTSRQAGVLERAGQVVLAAQPAACVRLAGR